MAVEAVVVVVSVEADRLFVRAGAMHCGGGIRAAIEGLDGLAFM